MKNTGKNDKDDIIRLIREEGLLYTSPDFTSKVMNRIEPITFPAHYSYKPIIGIKGWIIISSSVAMLLTCCIIMLFSGSYAANGYLDFLDPVFGFFRSLEFSMNVNLGSVFIGGMVFISVVILLSVDLVFKTKISLD